MLALATIATAWSGYQAAIWQGDQNQHQAREVAAIVRAAKYAGVAEQRRTIHVNLFAQWAGAVSTNNQALADFLFRRFPEPLKTAATAWRATEPLTNPSAPATPFELPEYVIAEATESDRWHDLAAAEADAALRANDNSNRYLRFTITFASVLFFAGISGKFKWQAIDVAVLVFGGLALLYGVVFLFMSPTK